MSAIFEFESDLNIYGLVKGPERSVCSRHFEETGIKTYIKTKGVNGVCEYCKKERNVVQLEDLMIFLMKTVSHFYTDPVNFSSYSAENGYDVPGEDAWTILQEDFELEVEEYDLFNDMEKWIDFSKTWANEKQLYGEGHYRRPESWAHFCYLVKHEVRYLFQNYNDPMNPTATSPFDILKEVEEMIMEYSLIKKIDGGANVVRSRQHASSEVITKASQMCAPQIEFCNYPNRMSPAGISMFYCAFDIKTALSETIDYSVKNSNYTTVTFSTKEDINVIDLSELPLLPSAFDINKRKLYEDVLFLTDFVNDLTKPVARDGKVHIEYVPTQIVTEFFRYMGKTKVDGIVYPSSKNRGKKAMVLFYDHYTSLNSLDFMQSTLVTTPI